MIYTKESLMSQAQCFASAWSLVGGPFDSGDGLDYADQAKSELAEMVGAIIQQRDELLTSFKAARKSLDKANLMLGGPISDTIWHGPVETLFDFMDAVIAKCEAAK